MPQLFHSNHGLVVDDSCRVYIPFCISLFTRRADDLYHKVPFSTILEYISDLSQIQFPHKERDADGELVRGPRFRHVRTLVFP